MSNTITITNDISEISGLLNSIMQFGMQNSVPEEILADIKLAVEEVVSNIIFYGFDDDAPHTILISPEVSDTVFVVCVEDDGKPFNPVSYYGKEAGSPLEEYEQGGMGLILIKELMDDIDYKFTGGKNTLCMKKLISAHP